MKYKPVKLNWLVLLTWVFISTVSTAIGLFVLGGLKNIYYLIRELFI